MKLSLFSGVNGNYLLEIFSDGTKIRTTNSKVLIPSWPESMDLKITNRCANACPYCHENSTSNGEHGDIDMEFLKQLPRGMEVAIGGGNPLAHPRLVELLSLLKRNGQFANMTIHKKDWEQHSGSLRQLVNDKMLHGLGISWDGCEFKDTNFPAGTVIHIIAGVHNDLQKLHDAGIKTILVLGYKNFGRGKLTKIVQQQIESIDVPYLLNEFDTVSFDNLALEQLNIKQHVSPELWDECYMGSEGEYTMYVDLVKKEYGINSRCPYNERKPITENNIIKMFNIIREQYETTNP